MIFRYRQCSSGPGRLPDRHPPLLSGQSLNPATTSHHVRLWFTRHQTGVHHVHPSGLPLAHAPGMEPATLRLPPELRTPPSPATHVRGGDRPSSTDLELPFNSHPSISNPVVHSIRATSRRTATSREAAVGGSETCCDVIGVLCSALAALPVAPRKSHSRAGGTPCGRPAVRVQGSSGWDAMAVAWSSGRPQERSRITAALTSAPGFRRPSRMPRMTEIVAPTTKLTMSSTSMVLKRPDAMPRLSTGPNRGSDALSRSASPRSSRTISHASSGSSPTSWLAYARYGTA
jgi:hypothetical protein